MLKIISRLITFIVFISLLIYLAGLYGLPWLGRTVLTSYGFDRASIGAASIERNAVTFRNIHLSASHGHDSELKTFRVKFAYTPPYLRAVTINGAELHAELTPEGQLDIAGKSLRTQTSGNAKPLTLQRLLRQIRLPTLPFETLALEDATLAIHTPEGEIPIEGMAVINAEREFNMQLKADSQTLTLDLPVMGTFHAQSGRLEKLDARMKTFDLNLDKARVKNAEAQLNYQKNKPQGKRLDLEGRSESLAFQQVKVRNLIFSANSENQHIDFSATINRMQTSGITLNGLSARISLDSLRPLATYATSHFAIQKADLGVPVTNITGAYHIAASKPELITVKADFAGGHITLKPTSDIFGYILNAETLDLSTLVQYSQVNGLTMKGKVGGKLPIQFDDENGIIINDGHLSGGEGGHIRYKPLTYPAALQGKNMRMATARKALRQLDLNSLEFRLNGPLRGDLEAELAIRGRNPDFSNRPVHFNLNLSGAIMRAVQQGLNIRFGTPTLKQIKQKLKK